MSDAPGTRPTTRSVMVAVATWLSLAAAATFFAPSVDLSASWADALVLVTDTGSPWLPMVGLALVAIVVSRPGLLPRDWLRHGVAIASVLVVVMTATGLFNEHVVKPWLAVPRPNIVELVDRGALGPDIDDPADFYAVGNKAARRVLLRDRIDPRTTTLTDRVREHWIHETGYSFPSGHAMASATLAMAAAGFGAAWLTGWRRWCTVVGFPVWAAAVAWTRVLLGVHRPVDVIAGTWLGIVWGLVAYGFTIAALRRLEEKRNADLR